MPWEELGKSKVSIDQSNPGISNAVALTGSNVPDAQPVPFKEITKLQAKVVLADAVAISDTSVHYYATIDGNKIPEEVMRQYSDFKISFYNSHNQPANIAIFVPVMARGKFNPQVGSEIYSEEGVLDRSSTLIIQSGIVGTGGGSKVKSVPALKSVFSALTIRVKFPVAPTSGTLTIVIECH